MNVLYKYCDTYGIERILEDLELKIPYISAVNDPLECSPVFHCPDDNAIESSFQFSLNGAIIPPAKYKQLFKSYKQTIQNLLKTLPKDVTKVNKKSCLLSVSKTAQNIVMWAHYAEKHKGGVIGIDFDKIHPNANEQLGILMQPVDYDNKRVKINVLEWYEKGTDEETIRKFSLTKSDSWDYEEEFRAAFPKEYMEELQQEGLSNFRKIKPEDTEESWLLKLNPASIKEVVFGLNANDLKEMIRKLKEKRQDLQHIQLRQATLSETYDFDINNIT